MDDKTQIKNTTKSAERYSFEKKADGTVLIKISVPSMEIEKVRGEVVAQLTKQINAPGFRKGNVPKNIAEQKLNPEAVREELLKKVLSAEYVAAVKQLNINPIVNPRIHVEQFTDGTNLEFSAETCEEPKIDLKNYKEEVRKIKPASTSSSLGGPAPKIIVPGQDEKSREAGSSSARLDQILEAVLNTAQITIPKVLIDQETNRLLSQLLDELKRLGVTLDQYLESRKITVEQLRAEYDTRAEKDLRLEFVLRKIADEEKITVEQKDVEAALAAVKDEKERQQIAQNPYLVAAIIRQQKTLDYLTTI